MNYIIFKYKKRSLNLKITKEEDKECLINSIKYCIKYLKMSNSNIGLRELKKLLRYETEKCENPIMEESLVIDLRNINEEIFEDIDNSLIDEDLVEDFNNIIGKKSYRTYGSCITMLLMTTMLKMVDHLRISRKDEIIILIVFIGIIIYELYNDRWIIADLKNSFKKIKGSGKDLAEEFKK